MAWKILFLTAIGVFSILGANIKDTSSKYKLVVDQDGGADDAMAVVMCLLYEKYFDGPEVVAITTTFGNVPEDQVYNNTQRFLDLTGRREVPIYRGATRSLVVTVESDFFFGYDGLGDNGNLSKIGLIEAQDEPAAFGLIELSKKYEGQLVIMAIGPLTNIALAQRLDPNFIGRLAQLYVGAGHIHDDRIKLASAPEFNALLDAEAYRIVADSAIPKKVTLVPFSQTLKSLNVTNEWRVNVLGAIDTKLSKALLEFERLSLMNQVSWTLLDPAVAAIVLDHNVVREYKYSNNSIKLCGADRGFNTNDLESEEPNVRLVYSAKKYYYMQLLIDIFSAELEVLRNLKKH